MENRNFQRELDQIIERQQAECIVPALLLHSCCAPCSSYCIEYLSRYFRVTVFYYNPNITNESEYRHRVEEQKRLITLMPVRYPVSFIEGSYEPERFLETVHGMETLPEGGARCKQCFRLRLFETGRTAAQRGFDYFTTTLTISPLKNAALLNAVGEDAADACGVKYLPSDFKKKNGYKRSIELSKQYELYRQAYCGCVFSENEAKQRGRL